MHPLIRFIGRKFRTLGEVIPKCCQPKCTEKAAKNREKYKLSMYGLRANKIKLKASVSCPEGKWQEPKMSFIVLTIIYFLG